jgi:hypothetical protein
MISNRQVFWRYDFNPNESAVMGPLAETTIKLFDHHYRTSRSKALAATSALSLITALVRRAREGSNLRYSEGACRSSYGIGRPHHGSTDWVRIAGQDHY